MPNGAKKISEVVIKRLPRYFRLFKDLKKHGIDKISSLKIAEAMGVTASQVRQDFCSFGEFGQQGYGYDVEKMTEEFAAILGLGKTYNMIVVGAGNIGRALAGYRGFRDEGFILTALFDILTDKESINGIPVYHADTLTEYAKNNRVDIAVIAAQASKAESILNILTDAGIKNIWNFTPVELKSTKDIIVENMSMNDSLYVLSYRMNKKNKQKK